MPLDLPQLWREHWLLLGSGANLICVYCGEDVEEHLATEDHVIARSWYPSSALSQPKWKAPSCFTCNNRFSLIEDEVLRRLALCINPRDPALRKIVDNVKRSMDPRFGRTPADQARRLSRRRAILADLKDGISPSDRGVLPFFHRNFREGSRTGILIKGADLEAIGAKWMRGIHFCQFGETVPAGAALGVHFVADDVARQAFSEIWGHGIRLHRGPGVQVAIFDAAEGEERSTLYAFQLWHEFKLYGSIEIGGALEGGH
ncbi:MAG: hypothetical protein R3D05_01370 [Dongiaceae bacterium]